MWSCWHDRYARETWQGSTLSKQSNERWSWLTRLAATILFSCQKGMDFTWISDMLLLPMWEKKMTVSIHKQKELIPLERHHNKYYNNDLLELPVVTLSWHGSKYMVHVLLMEVMHVVSYLPAYQVTVAVGDSGFCCCGTSFECNRWFYTRLHFVSGYPVLEQFCKNSVEDIGSHWYQVSRLWNALVLMYVFTVLFCAFLIVMTVLLLFLIVMLILIYALFYSTCDYFSVCEML